MVCDNYAILTETATGHQKTICGSNERIKQVYVSKSSMIDVAIMMTNNRHFLIEYEGKMTAIQLSNQMESS